MRHEAIYNTHKNVTSIVDETPLDSNGGTITLDESKVDTELARLQAEYDSNEYARLRKAEYPSIEECVHAMLDGDLDELQAKRQEVKARFPK